MPFDPDAYTADSRENWSRAAARYEALSSGLFGPITAAFVALAGPARGARALDAACGPGTATRALAAAVGPEGSVLGVDLAPGMLALARERAAGLANVSFAEMNAEALSLPDGAFGAVVCQLGLMLFARPEAALREFARVARPGGVVACLVQGAPERMLFTSLVMKTMVRHAPQLKAPGAPNIYAFAPEGVLEAALAAAGLAEVSSRRLAGVFLFESPEAYWKSMTEASGRTGVMLKSLPAEVQAAVEKDVLAAAAALRRGREGVEIPFEVVMARGVKPSV